MISDNEPADLDDAEDPLAAVSEHPGDSEIRSIEEGYRARLIAASLRTEAVRAGMVDLDGLKLLDTSTIGLNSDDSIINGRQLMQVLKKSKPWLFRSASSSSLAAAPSHRPMRQKTAMEMTDDEYAAARSAIIRQ
jgi:hypothetical protein